MPWTRIIPKNAGGGGWRSDPAATLYPSGQLTLTAAAVEMLGSPARVIVEANAEALAIRLTPTTPDDAGGFSLSGGGNSPARIGCRDMRNRFPDLVGKYTVHKLKGGIELRKEK